MNVPGFTAESSLHGAEASYRMRSDNASSPSGVIPAASRFCGRTCARIANGCTGSCRPDDFACRDRCSDLFFSCMSACSFVGGIFGGVFKQS